MNLTTIKSKIHSHAKNYLIMKVDFLTVNIIYQVDNGVNLDLMIGALNDILKTLNERKIKNDPYRNTHA